MKLFSFLSKIQPRTPQPEEIWRNRYAVEALKIPQDDPWSEPRPEPSKVIVREVKRNPYGELWVRYSYQSHTGGDGKDYFHNSSSTMSVEHFIKSFVI